jgi:hypothetical protein
MSSSSSSPVPGGYVWLVLLQGLRSSFYLEIPSDIIGSLCFEAPQTVLHLENDVDAADQDVGRSGGIVAPGVRESFG